MPAGIYLANNVGDDGSEGWGVPMATDIAFALGVLALLGDRVPILLKVFLTALAIVDDIIAVLVIVFFYTAAVHWDMLALAAGVLAALVAANRLGVRQAWAYGPLGLVLWAAVFESGVHATVAGVLLALTIPARTRIDPGAFAAKGRSLLDEFNEAGPDIESILTNNRRQDILAELKHVVEGAGTPLQRFEHALHSWVAYAIVPIFALANAGVELGGDMGDAGTSRVTLGVVLGLMVGKQAGITLFAWLAARSGQTELPEGVSWRQIYGAGCLAGIGFTMSLFVAELAFIGQGEADLLTDAKSGILRASAIAGTVGWVFLSRGHRA